MKKLLILAFLLVASRVCAIEPPLSPLTTGQVLSATYLNTMFRTIYDWSNGIQATSLVTGTATFGLEGTAIPFTNATGSYFIFAEGVTGAKPKIQMLAFQPSSTSTGTVVILAEYASGTNYITPSWDYGSNLKMSYPASISIRFVIQSY